MSVKYGLAKKEKNYECWVNLGWVNKGLKIAFDNYTAQNGPVHYQYIAKSLGVSMSP